MVVLKLQSLGVPHQVLEGNSQILVPVDKTLSLRMYFAQEGLLQSGNILGYEIFDKDTGLGSSQFLNNINMMRALEGELSRTINSLYHIESSRVHLVFPKRDIFSKSDIKPSASIMLRIKNGASISKKEVEAIAHLVSKAVPELSQNNISIMDNKGNSLKTPGDDGVSLFGDGSDFNLMEYQSAIENKLKNTIENLLESHVGEGKVRASVRAEVNGEREVIASEVYDPDGQVVRSKKTNEEKELDKESNDNISVANNIPNSNQEIGNSPQNTKSKSKLDDITNYEISKTVTNKIIPGGNIERLSIAVMVDGIYTHNEKTGKSTYSDRDELEISKLKTLVESAMGFSTKRGDKLDLVNLKFINTDIQDNNKNSTWFDENGRKAIQMGMIGIVSILVILLIFKPIISRLLQNSGDSILDIKKIFASPTGLNTEEGNTQSHFSSSQENDKNPENSQQEIQKKLLMRNEKYTEAIKNTNNLVEEYSEEAVAIIKKWIHNDHKT
ncbi:MAG: flagellar M-ring protein FliF [Candidatus Midichloriaceae bacterium]